MSSSLISIVVPVYNVEKYLPRCIESILRQTYTDFELILVDDGTPDRSGIICDRYAEKDSRIQVIHKENGGVSTARNAGIDAARGEWITFIDSDDWVSDNYLEALLQPFSERDYDLTVGQMEWRSVRIVSYGNTEHIISEKMNSFATLRAFDKMEFLGTCYKLFSKNIIEKNNLRFSEGVKMAEDAIFMTEYLRYCKSIYMTGKKIYYYNCLNNHSVTNKSQYFDDKNTWSSEYIEHYNEMISAFGASDQLQRSLVAKKALEICCTNINYILKYFANEEAKEKINETLDCFNRYFSEDYHTIIEGDLDMQKNFEYILNRDIQSIYERLKPSKKNFLRKRLRYLFIVVVKPFLEKYRDGLVKFKFQS